MRINAILRRAVSPGRGGLPLNPEDEEEEEGDDARFRGQGKSLLRLFG